VPVDMTVRYDGDGVVLPAMPHDIFAMYPATKMAFFRCTQNQPDCPMLHSTSLTTILKVTNVPLKPLARTLNKPEHKAAVEEGHDGLSTCYPEGICTLNIGSNRGLIRLLRNHYDCYCIEHKGERYTSLNVDNNIFDRILKVHPAHTAMKVKY
jgi:hypothetical protein